MDGLRGFLLLFGLLVIAGVYFYSRQGRRQAEESGADRDTARIEPELGVEPQTGDGDGLDVGAESPRDDTADSGPNSSAQEQKFVTLRIVARDHGSFAGDYLALSLRGIGMRHGKFGIFHRYEGNDETSIIFSAASLVEPGSFDLASIKEQEIPGISLFMVLPGPVDGPTAFDLMMVAARVLTESLDAELLDESGSTLSVQREHYMREEIIQYQTSNLVH